MHGSRPFNLARQASPTMQEHIQLTQKEINQDLLSGILGTPKWWLVLVAFLLMVFLAGAGAFGYMLNKGVGVTGLNRPVMWGVFMTNFVLAPGTGCFRIHGGCISGSGSKPSIAQGNLGSTLLREPIRFRLGAVKSMLGCTGSS